MKRIIYLIMLFLGLTTFNSTARTIRGSVYGADDKKPIPGVSIFVKGTNIRTSTDLNGQFAVVTKEEKVVLLFSMIGYEFQQVEAKKSNTINIWLQPAKTSLQEVVVMGYQTQRKRVFTASVSTVPGTTLTGKVAGIQIRGAATVLQDRESYKGIIENGFLNPVKEPLSTFAIDVDQASYSNVRRMINQGQLPPKDAVRTEELLNYFHYDLQDPVNQDPVAIHTELSSAPWNPRHRLLRIALKAKALKTEQLPPSNLVFLLDISGSMEGPNRLSLVKASMKMLVDQLRPEDHVAIVTYAGTAGLKLGSTSGDQKTKLKEAIDQLEASGSTAGGDGIKMAYQIAREHFIKQGNNRIVLATDGDFNVGASSDEDMEKLVANEKNSGISLSVLGFGMGNLKDSKMETIADKGHGNYAYIDNISQARKAMVTEFGSTLFTVAKDVKIQVEFNPGKVQAYRLIGYENRLLTKEDFNNDEKMGGDMGAGHSITALYEIIPAGLKDNFSNVDPLKYQKPKDDIFNNTSLEIVTVKFRYKNPDSKKSRVQMTTLNDEPTPFSKTTDDFRFASAVAEFGLLLRNSEYKQQSDFTSLIARAKAAKGKDDEGYRTEFISLAENAKLLSKNNDIAMNEK
ncbi:vWA domain-containing protein [Pedobacter sp.]|uniref:vWA domain-containing protein n=1 Tax=Pedobacter sp. TaxID=1411316 RepID=UPI002CD0580F|nr:von Willebrand factor type A domain-containing protein [Pedobacter sp.]HWW42763.1 von Willebrand factor type A domain-containing protein [Pedobacter sp.]